jgi:putative ABC transport system ATP-binding protein
MTLDATSHLVCRTTRSHRRRMGIDWGERYSACMGAASTDPPVVRARLLTKEYASGDVRIAVLKEIDLAVDRGEYVALQGPSGSGKTTLLNLIAGLDTPTSGSVTVLGQCLDDLNERRRTRFRADHVGLVFQESYLIPGLSAVENATLGRLPWERRALLHGRAKSLLTRLGLGDRLQHPPSHLSGGERQRVGLARALLGRPELLLADEPTGNLDAESTGLIITLLKELQAELNLTLIVATHDQQVASAAGRVVHLEKGAIRQPDAA